MKAIIRFFIALWRFFFPAKQTIVPPTISDRMENAKENADDVVKRYGHTQHNNRTNKKNKRGKTSRLVKVQYLPNGKVIYHDNPKGL